MKKNIYTIVIISFVLFAFSCGNKANQQSETHTHADGTVHEGTVHNEGNESKPEQENFEVDTTSLNDHQHDDHDHDHDHQH